MSGQELILLVIVAGALLILLLLIRLLQPRHDPYPYQKANALFTESELLFLRVLDEAVEEDYRILGKVRLADIIVVAEGTEGSQWQSAFNKIRAKHLDFVGCNPETLEIEWVLELDDPSHERPERQERDAFLEAALARAGVDLIRIPTAEEYDPDEIWDQIENR